MQGCSRLGRQRIPYSGGGPHACTARIWNGWFSCYTPGPLQCGTSRGICHPATPTAIAEIHRVVARGGGGREAGLSPSGRQCQWPGGKVGPTERLGEGSVAQLHFHPPDGSSLDVEAIVWRVDRDGLAFFFTDDHQRRLTTLLAQLAGVPPALWTTPLN